MAPGSGCTPLCASECAFSPPEEPPAPSAAIEWTEPVGQEYRGVGGEERLYDGDKKVKGRNKRHLLVDTQKKDSRAQGQGA